MAQQEWLVGSLAFPFHSIRRTSACLHKQHTHFFTFPLIGAYFSCKQMY
jgi:hypothetical protein